VIGDSATVLEAARATIASPTYFDSVKIGKRELFDGALGANNPVQHAWSVAKSSWPDRPVECLLSLGSGHQPLAHDTPSLGKVEIIRSIAAIATETERTAQNFVRANGAELRGGKYFRFCPMTFRQDVSLDDSVTVQSTVADAVDRYLSTRQQSEMIANLARRLSQLMPTGGHNSAIVQSPTSDAARRLVLSLQRDDVQETDDEAPRRVESSSDAATAHVGLPTAIDIEEKGLSIEHPVMDQVTVSKADAKSEMFETERTSRVSKVRKKIIIANAIARTMLHDSKLRPLLETAATGVGKVRMERNLSILLSYLGQGLSALDWHEKCNLLGTVVIRF
jgi:hypothetical protein